MLPLGTLLLGAAVGLAPLTARGLTGSAVAAAGIVVIVVEQLGASVPPLGLLALGATTLAYATALVLLKRVPPGHPTPANAIAMSIGTPIMLGLSVLAHEQWSIPTGPATLASFVYLVVVATILFYELGLFVIERLTAAAASYTDPGPRRDGGPGSGDRRRSIEPTTILGGLFVVVGVWLGAFSSPRSRGEAAPVPTDTPPAEVAVRAET